MDASPRVGDGLIRLDADGNVQYASPNALSAYHRLGLAADLVGTDLGPATAELAPRPRPGGRVAGEAGQRLGAAGVRGGGGDGRHPAAGHPAQAQGRAHRFAGAAARRHRTAPPRAGADHQGRHHPGDPPPGEEQPPDGGRPAAAPGPPDGLRAGPGRRWRRRCAGSGRSRSCTRRCPRPWTRRSSSTRSPTGCWRWRGDLAPGRVTPARRAVRHPRRRDGDAAVAWCSPSCCRTRSNTAGSPAGPAPAGTVDVTVDPRPPRSPWSVRTTAAGCRRGSRQQAGQPGAPDRPHPGGRRTRRPAGDLTARGRGHRGAGRPPAGNTHPPARRTGGHQTTRHSQRPRSRRWVRLTAPGPPP